jgi:hypothetical protein
VGKGVRTGALVASRQVAHRGFSRTIVRGGVDCVRPGDTDRPGPDVTDNHPAAGNIPAEQPQGCGTSSGVGGSAARLNDPATRLPDEAADAARTKALLRSITAETEPTLDDGVRSTARAGSAGVDPDAVLIRMLC